MSDFFWFSLFVALNGLLLVTLAAYVSVLRLRLKISYGDGGNNDLLKAIRVHANGMEQVPIFALQLLALVHLELGVIYQAILVICFTLARVAHAGMLFRLHLLRQLGATLTYLLQIVAALLLVFMLLFV